MTLIEDVLDLPLLREMAEQKYVRGQMHPDFPEIRILNYTETATWENVWNDVTLQCRGLIYNNNTNEVLARPFRKFFNHEQEQAPTFSLDDRLHVTDKADGSLGILYPVPKSSGMAIATRGSFASEQAIWASAHYRRHYRGRWAPNPDWTYLYEIVYPENRIVVDYYGWEGLVLLGAVDTATGLSIPVEHAKEGWPGPSVELIHQDLPLGEILAMPPRENREGFVLWHPESDERVKIKYDDYVLLHKFMTNTSEKNVWEALSQGLDMEATFAGAPDEFHEWIKSIVKDLKTQHAHEKMLAIDSHKSVIECVLRYPGNRGKTKEDFEPRVWRKMLAEESESMIPFYRGLLFMIEDGRSIDDAIWKQIKPVGSTTFRKVDTNAD